MPGYFFFFARELRDRSLERDWEVSRTRVVCGLVARPDVRFVGPFGRKVVLFSFFGLLFWFVYTVNWKTLTVSLFDCYTVGKDTGSRLITAAFVTADRPGVELGTFRSQANALTTEPPSQCD